MFPLKFPSQTSNPASARRNPEHQESFHLSRDLTSQFTECFSPMSDHPVSGATEQSVLQEDDRPGLGVFSVETVETVDCEDVAVRSHHPVLRSLEPGVSDHLHLTSCE